MRAMLKRLLSVRAALVLTGAGLLVANCSQSDTVLLVHVTASMPVDGVQQLHATIRVGGQTHAKDVPDAPVPITLPTSFTVQLARSFSGDLSINIDARDATGAVVASGNQTVSPLQVGTQNELTIDLAPGPAPDAGTDGPSTTAGTGGAPGTGGTVGTGGLSGTGGTAVGSGGATAGTGGSSGANGGSAGGTAGRGGGGGRGGALGTGGRASGGAVGTGGTPTGGTVGTGGASSGGMVGSGGVVGTGGMTATGGTSTGGGGDAGGTAGLGGEGGDGS